ncbi:hypothetical protein JCM10207_007553 [Rhodosporidiobolus poonsookiae]
MDPTPAESYYETLGVPPTASPDEIRAAYLVLAKTVHPDRVPPHEKAEATRLFAQLAAAYSTLSDPQRRKQYDRTLGSTSALVPFAAPVAARPPSPAFHAPPHPRRAPSPTNSPFPGYSVPPGGYPHTPAERPVFDDSPLFGFDDPRRDGSTDRDPLFPPPPAFPTGLFNPFALFDSVMALQRRAYDDPFPYSPAHHSYPRPPHAHPHPHRPSVPTRRASASYTDGAKHRNGDWRQTSARKDVSESADGTVRWREVKTTVEFTSGRPRRPSFDGGYGYDHHSGWKNGLFASGERDRLLLEDHRPHEYEHGRGPLFPPSRPHLPLDYPSHGHYDGGYEHGHGHARPPLALPGHSAGGFPPRRPPSPALHFPPHHLPPHHHPHPHHPHHHHHPHHSHHPHHHRPPSPCSTRTSDWDCDSSIDGGRYRSGGGGMAGRGALVRRASLGAL